MFLSSDSKSILVDCGHQSSYEDRSMANEIQSLVVPFVCFAENIISLYSVGCLSSTIQHALIASNRIHTSASFFDRMIHSHHHV